MSAKKQKGLQKRFISFIRQNLTDTRAYESPMALYEWFLKEWGRPLSPARQQQAYLAAWAVSIDKGMVKL